MLEFLYAHPLLFVLLFVVLVRFVIWLVRPPHWQDLEESRGGQYNYRFMSWW